jgi:hypothetical protein
MRIQRFFGLVLLLGWVGPAPCQDGSFGSVTDEVPWSGTHEPRETCLSSPHGAAWESGQQLQRHPFPYGSLWDSYCCEKMMPREAEACPPPNSLRMPLVPPPSLTARRVALHLNQTLDRARKACQQQRVVCFERFCGLLGWHACRCRAGHCAARSHACCDQRLTEPPGDVSDASFDESSSAPPPTSSPEPPWPVADPTLTQPPVDEAADTVEEKAEVHDPAGADDPPPAPPEPARTVPRNELPKAAPASSRRPRTGVPKVLVVERLSDYITL